MDCGPTCLKMIAAYYGKNYNIDTLRRISGYGMHGVSMLALSKAARKIGFKAEGINISMESLSSIELPAIMHWTNNHFVVLLEVKKNKYKIANPEAGIIEYTEEDLLRSWAQGDGQSGYILLLQPDEESKEIEEQPLKKLDWSFVTKYLRFRKMDITVVFIALLLVMVINFTFPFVAQNLIDNGVTDKNLSFVTLLLLAQGMLIISRTVIDFVRSRIMLKVTSYLNFQIVSDFWIKLTSLPLNFFEKHRTGDILQRINDSNQVQRFFTETTFSTIFSLLNFCVYAVILITYSVELFGIFLIGSALYFLWITYFLKYRREINHKYFTLASLDNTTKIQMVQGIKDIKLNNAERERRWEWENLQVAIFNLNLRSLNINQLQQAGASLILQIQGLFLSYLVARYVIDGKLTLGAMLSIQYILAQLTGPITQWIGMIQTLQDTKISIERLNEVQHVQEEKSDKVEYCKYLPADRSIIIKDLSFSYPDIDEEVVLKNIDLEIPENKVTAIIGSSGSGKTSLIKMLQKVYSNYKGEMYVGRDEKVPFNKIEPSYWRSKSASISSDSFIFNGTILDNLTIGSGDIDYDRVYESCKIANIHDFIESLPRKYYTVIGDNGMSFSQGQRQRLLIARAVYRKSDYLFLDEATSALDSQNEYEIMQNLRSNAANKTVVISTHRLSTIQHADQIIVLENGEIIEQGTHDYLMELRGRYFRLANEQFIHS